MVSLAERDRGSLTQQLREFRIMKESNTHLRLDSWVEYGSTIDDYQSTFDTVLNGNRIVDFLANVRNPVVLDLMSPSDTLADLFEQLHPGPRLGVAVSLGDRRADYQKDRDGKLGIVQIEGDLTQSQTWRRIEHTLQGKKVNLIMERAQAGLCYVPVNEKFFAIILSKTWRLLSRNHGAMFLQMPERLDMESNDIRYHDWIELLLSKGIDADCKESPRFPYNRGILRIIKNPYSPEELPTLPHR